MNSFPKPVVVLSNCLEYETCRYNGAVIPDNFVRNLEPYVTYKMVCPEVGIDLGVPRDPVRIISEDGKKILVQPSTNKDLTKKINSFSRKYVKSLGDEVDGFILKSGSPSCGIKNAKIYETKGKGSVVGKTNGFFTNIVLSKLSGLAIEDEGRLKNFNIRDHFLTKLFTLARFRHIKKRKSIKDLIEFHSTHKLLFMSYNQNKMREIGKIIGSYNKKNLNNIINSYQSSLFDCLTKMPRKTSFINSLMHCLGYFSNNLKSREKSFFLEQLQSYRNNKIPVSALLIVLRAWSIKYEQEYLLKQVFFEPYPPDLMNVSDSGKGRSLINRR
ncbi:MAG: DUF1722 domain-containing protein [Candidatus Dadabacteria bacterium]|nr:DUF1722 domain-containing protein [Candidatus Dadabacteria bacterium]NIQ15129.1 DUF1722 domain-containing protein [Candidatus Dadabacteria bacterium]